MRAADELQLDIVAILTTHKHEDHTAGNKRIACDLPGLPIYGPIECKEKEHAITHFVHEGDVIEIGATKFTVMETPYHTSGHISYFAERPAEADVPPALFCGDALFVGGCGRFFEGDGADMVATFDKIFLLPSETEVFCGHEYTLSNYEFALSVDPHNNYLIELADKAKSLRAHGLPTVPSTIGNEQSANPFAQLTVGQFAWQSTLRITHPSRDGDLCEK